MSQSTIVEPAGATVTVARLADARDFMPVHQLSVGRIGSAGAPDDRGDDHDQE